MAKNWADSGFGLPTLVWIHKHISAYSISNNFSLGNSMKSKQIINFKILKKNVYLTSKLIYWKNLYINVYWTRMVHIPFLWAIRICSLVLLSLLNHFKQRWHCVFWFSQWISLKCLLAEDLRVNSFWQSRHLQVLSILFRPR